MSPTNHFNADTGRPWTLAEIYDDLGSRQDIAKALNISMQRLEAWLERRADIKCPHPIKKIGHIHVYSIQEWRDWHTGWVEKHKGTPWEKQVTDTKPHGSGEAFWDYFLRNEK